MALNPNIILQQFDRDPAGDFYRAYDSGLKRERDNDAEASNNALAQYVSKKPKGQKLSSYLDDGGYPVEALEYGKQEAELAKSNATAQETQGKVTRQILEVAGSFSQELLADQNLTKQGILQKYANYAKSGIVTPKMQDELSNEVNQLPDDPQSLRQWAQGKHQMVMKAAEMHGFLEPSANSRLSAETSRRGQDIGAETSRRNADLNYNLGERKLASQEGQNEFNQAYKLDVLDREQRNKDRSYALDARKASPALNKKQNDANEALDLLDMADKIIDNSTSSFIGTGADYAARSVGYGTKGADALAQLKTIEGMLVSKMPRLEGPQGVADLLLYRQMAGQIADGTLPISTRRQAMQTIREIQNRHAGVQSRANTGGASGSFGKPDDWDEFMQSRGR
jgi:hypothetical protein